MLIFCPDCQRQLRVPDSAAGKQVKCPACQKIFAAGAGTSGEQIQAPMPKYPAPPPDSFEPEALDDEPRRPRRSKRYDGGDIDDDEQFIFRGGGAEAQRRANAGAAWFFAAAPVTICVFVANLITTIAVGALEDPFGGPDRQAALGAMVCGIVGCGSVFLALNVLILTAGIQLKSFGVKGWVVTGIVLAFLQTLFFGGGALINVVVLAVNTREALDNWAPLTVILSGSAGFLNCFAGVKAIMVLNNEAVAAEFEQRKPRRRRRRRQPEW